VLVRLITLLRHDALEAKPAGVLEHDAAIGLIEVLGNTAERRQDFGLLASIASGPAVAASKHAAAD